jgi:hypothetical protein
MNRLFTAVTLAALIASPAFAQSSDPSVGSGNIAPQAVEEGALGAYAQQSPGHIEHRDARRAVQPVTAAEKALFDGVRKE